jgi:hypothetical protein
MSKKYAICMRWKKNDYYMRTDGDFGKLMFSARELKLFNTKAEAEFILAQPEFQQYRDAYIIEELAS